LRSRQWQAGRVDNGHRGTSESLWSRASEP
jgi:hypothetical protein